MKNYISAWYDNLLEQTSIPIKLGGEAWGKCDLHTGGLLLYAQVKISINPSEKLRVLNHLDRDKLTTLTANDWLAPIVYGVLDVMLVDITGPHKIFLLDILDVEINEIESKQIAFRLAAQDATRKIISEL